MGIIKDMIIMIRPIRKKITIHRNRYIFIGVALPQGINKLNKKIMKRALKKSFINSPAKQHLVIHSCFAAQTSIATNTPIVLWAVLLHQCGKDAIISYNMHTKFSGRKESRIQGALESLNDEGFHPQFHPLDVCKADSVHTLRDHLKQQYGGLDVLINNATVAWVRKSRNVDVHP